MKSSKRPRSGQTVADDKEQRSDQGVCHYSVDRDGQRHRAGEHEYARGKHSLLSGRDHQLSDDPHERGKAPIASSLRAVLVFSDMSGHRAQGVYLEHCDGLQVECLREQVHGDEPARRIPSLGESLHVPRECGRVA